MGFLDRFEKRFRKYSISNITLYVIVARIIFFAMAFINTDIIKFLLFLPDRVLAGEVWRLVTFIFVPDSGNLIFFFFEIMFFYWIGTGLENVWGSFRFTLYYLGGILGAAITAGLAGLLGGLDVLIFAYSVSEFFTMSLFLAFVWYYGEEMIRLMFFLPIKVKYLAVIDIILILQAFVYATWGGRLVLLASMLNLIIFYIFVLTKTARNKKRYISFKSKVKQAEKSYKSKARHRCTVCGITELTHPDMQFRYCSKCEGDYEFCEEHLRNHEHRTNIIEFKKPGDDQ